MSEKQSLPKSIAGFTVLPISYSKSTTHVLYARAHVGSKKASAKDARLPDGRTLFIVNVPPDATEREIVMFFKHCGTVERVVFDRDAQETQNHDESSDEESELEDAGPDAMDVEERQPRKKRKLAKEEKDRPPQVVPLPTKPVRTLRKTGSSAHVIFLDSSSLQRALAQPQKPRPWPTSPDEPLGLSHYTSLWDSLRPPLDAVREHADTYIELYDYELAKSRQKAAYKKGEAIVDEDGFTLVTRGGAYGKTLGGGVGVASKRFQESGEVSKRKRKKKEAKETEGFYAFQIREKKRNQLLELQKNWEADKARVEKLKASKRFKPY